MNVTLRRRRVLGWALVGHGGAGLAIAAAGLFFVAGSLGPVTGPVGSLDEQRDALTAWLATTSRTLGDASAAAGRVDGSLGSTASAAGEAALLTDELAVTMRQLASAMELELFGSRPFGALADDFGRVADRAATLSTDLATAGAAIEANREDSRRVAADFADLRADIDQLRELVGASNVGDGGADPLAAARLLLVALLGWVAFGASISLVAGVALVRRPD